MVWLDLGLNSVLPDHWRTLYSLGQWPVTFHFTCTINIDYCPPKFSEYGGLAVITSDSLFFQISNVLAIKNCLSNNKPENTKYKNAYKNCLILHICWLCTLKLSFIYFDNSVSALFHDVSTNFFSLPQVYNLSVVYSYNISGFVCSLNRKPLKFVDQFMYLGSNIFFIESDVNIRIGKAWGFIVWLTIIYVSCSNSALVDTHVCSWGICLVLHIQSLAQGVVWEPCVRSKPTHLRRLPKSYRSRRHSPKKWAPQVPGNNPNLFGEGLSLGGDGPPEARLVFQWRPRDANPELSWHPYQAGLTHEPNRTVHSGTHSRYANLESIIS